LLCSFYYTLDHFLSCKKGGLIVQCHNEFRDSIGDLAALQRGLVRREPIVSGNPTSGCDEVLVADLGVCGVWSAQSETLFDIRISDTNAKSNLSYMYAPELFFFELKSRKSKRILQRHLLAALTLHHYAFLLMIIRL